MVCPVCPATGWLGGLVGGYFGVNAPVDWRGRMISAFITANLMCVTVIGLRYFFDISLCSPGRTSAEKIVFAGIKCVLLGVVYSVGVNYLLGRLIFTEFDLEEVSEEGAPSPPCCRKVI